MKPCKQCGLPVRSEECSHLNCKESYVKGFCCYGCQQVYETIKAHEYQEAGKVA